MLWPALVLIVSTTLNASVNVIYGDDNRVDVYESSNSQYVELSKSTAAMIPSSTLIMDVLGGFDIGGKNLREDVDLCK